MSTGLRRKRCTRALFVMCTTAAELRRKSSIVARSSARSSARRSGVMATDAASEPTLASAAASPAGTSRASERGLEAAK